MIDFHPNPLDVIFFIVSGTGRISLENGSYDVRKGDCAPVPGGIDRKWENTGSDTLHVLVIKQVK